MAAMVLSGAFVLIVAQEGKRLGAVDHRGGGPLPNTASYLVNGPTHALGHLARSSSQSAMAALIFSLPGSRTRMCQKELMSRSVLSLDCMATQGGGSMGEGGGGGRGEGQGRRAAGSVGETRRGVAAWCGVHMQGHQLVPPPSPVRTPTCLSPAAAARLCAQVEGLGPVHIHHGVILRVEHNEGEVHLAQALQQQDGRVGYEGLAGWLAGWLSGWLADSCRAESIRAATTPRCTAPRALPAAAPPHPPTPTLNAPLPSHLHAACSDAQVL